MQVKKPLLLHLRGFGVLYKGLCWHQHKKEAQLQLLTTIQSHFHSANGENTVCWEPNCQQTMRSVSHTARRIEKHTERPVLLIIIRIKKM